MDPPPEQMYLLPRLRGRAGSRLLVLPSPPSLQPSLKGCGLLAVSQHLRRSAGAVLIHQLLVGQQWAAVLRSARHCPCKIGAPKVFHNPLGTHVNRESSVDRDSPSVELGDLCRSPDDDRCQAAVHKIKNLRELSLMFLYSLSLSVGGALPLSPLLLLFLEHSPHLSQWHQLCGGECAHVCHPSAALLSRNNITDRDTVDSSSLSLALIDGLQGCRRELCHVDGRNGCRECKKRCVTGRTIGRAATSTPTALRLVLLPLVEIDHVCVGGSLLRLLLRSALLELKERMEGNRLVLISTHDLVVGLREHWRLSPHL
mmetsp:Transcript_2020/g.7299  ORF Transcript_2020/g.7299 Transcript_2020/m.7299 type:complete len:314 (+) Transcript_2020:1568-2509(+)